MATSPVVIILLGILAVGLCATEEENVLKATTFRSKFHNRQTGMRNLAKEHAGKLSNMPIQLQREFLQDLWRKKVAAESAQSQEQTPAAPDSNLFDDNNQGFNRHNLRHNRHNLRHNGHNLRHKGHNLRHKTKLMLLEEREEFLQKKDGEWKKLSPKDRRKIWRKRHGAALAEPEDIAENNDRDEIRIESRKTRAVEEPLQDIEERRESRKRKKYTSALQKVLDAQGMTWEEYNQMSSPDRKAMAKEARKAQKKESHKGERPRKHDRLPSERKGYKGEKRDKKKNHRERPADISDDVRQQIRTIKRDQTMDKLERKRRINQLIEELRTSDIPTTLPV